MPHTPRSPEVPPTAPTKRGSALVAAAGRAWRRAAPHAWSVAVFAVIVAVTGRMVLGPVHAVRDAKGCRRAYAEARTRQDTVSVDRLSYPDSTAPRRRGRCVFQRIATLGALGR